MLKYIITLALFLLFGMSYCQTQINVYDDFESPGLSKIWRTNRMVAGAFEIQSQIKREGQNAAKISIKTGDVLEKGVNKNLDSERDELLEARSLMSKEGVKYEFQFSMFLPSDFPIVSTRLVIAQWKQYCQNDGLCSDDSPVIALRYVSGRLFITLQTDTGRTTLYELKDEIRNRWLDFKFQIRFSKLDNGEITAFLNNNEIVHFNGITSYSEKHGYPSDNKYYFKMGLYRDVMPAPMTIYIDEYRKREIVE
ncbi:MAG: heparin lyase I family protein [Bacteroidetes bacterium]|nr:heparin lyase I family protein [Bacteroidota bacterium]